MRNQKLIYATAAFLLLVLAGAIYLFSTNQATNEPDGAFVLRNPPASKVFIQDLHGSQYGFSNEAQESIKTMLYDHVGRNDPGLYTGTIRKDSYSREAASSRHTIKNFLVDVEPTKLTYQVSVIDQQSSSSVYILCAPQDKQLDKSAACEDSSHP